MRDLDIHIIGIIGAGTMGAGIAQTFRGGWIRCDLVQQIRKRDRARDEPHPFELGYAYKKRCSNK